MHRGKIYVTKELIMDALGLPVDTEVIESTFDSRMGIFTLFIDNPMLRSVPDDQVTPTYKAVIHSQRTELTELEPAEAARLETRLFGDL